MNEDIYINSPDRLKQNPRDAWLAPEHGRMGQGMKRPKRGIQDKDGAYLVLPGERILPVSTCLRLQEELKNPPVKRSLWRISGERRFDEPW